MQCISISQEFYDEKGKIKDDLNIAKYNAETRIINFIIDKILDDVDLRFGKNENGSYSYFDEMYDIWIEFEYKTNLFGEEPVYNLEVRRYLEDWCGYSAMVSYYSGFINKFSSGLVPVLTNTLSGLENGGVEKVRKALNHIVINDKRISDKTYVEVKKLLHGLCK